MGLRSGRDRAEIGPRWCGLAFRASSRVPATYFGVTSAPKIALKMREDASKMPQNDPRCTQDAPMMVPRGSKMGQDAPKMPQRWSQEAPKWAKMLPRWPQIPPRWPWRCFQIKKKRPGPLKNIDFHCFFLYFGFQRPLQRRDRKIFEKQ